VKRFFEYGVLGAALLTLIYIGLAFYFQRYMNLSTIFLCIGGGLISGVAITLLTAYFAPGVHIPEGEEDRYINN